MGQSFDTASLEKSAGDFSIHSTVYDKYRDMYYKPFWKENDYYIMEFRLKGKDTIHKLIEKVDYIVGSGQHTNSHIFEQNGFLHQMPLTFYTQRKLWDLPPGYEQGMNTRFSRKIGLECMSCHNGYPGFEKGSENKFTFVPKGIDCERCHGPGEAHVARKSAGEIIDTSKYIDYSIVNPGKLAVDLQFDVCQRCHLQGNAVLKNDKSFYDFKPGMKLSDYMTVFLPKYEGADQEFIMASHADRLKMSPCFIKTFKPGESGSLRPYKEALTCVTCHDPHVSVKETGMETFNSACRDCHGGSKKITDDVCDESMEKRKKVNDNCVSCHMPRSGSIDIPHVSVTDHYIRKPVKKENKAAIKRFIGLYAINEHNPSPQVKAAAYIQQCEKFEPQNLFLLDSAKRYLKDETKSQIGENLNLLVNLYYLKGDYRRIINYVNTITEKELLGKHLIKVTLENSDAWTAYRIGEAFSASGNSIGAEKFFNKAVTLAPLYPDFRVKYALAKATNGDLNSGIRELEMVINQNPRNVSALTNLGYLSILKKDFISARKYYDQAYKFDPDYEPLLLNIVGLNLYEKNYVRAKEMLNHILKRNPSNQKAKQILNEIKSLNG